MDSYLYESHERFQEEAQVNKTYSCVFTWKKCPGGMEEELEQEERRRRKEALLKKMPDSPEAIDSF